MTRPSPTPDSDTRADPQWIPAALPCDETVARLAWRYAGNAPLDDPFFFQTIDRLADEYPDFPERRTDLSILLEFADRADSLQPDAFIFHIGRCGSTALSNAFRAVAGAVSLSEPAPVTGLLLPPAAYRWPCAPDEWEAVKGDLFKGAVAALGRKRLGSERRYLIKFTEWNVLAIKFVRSLYPETPFVFLYRDPMEVVASYLATPPRRLLLRWLPAEMFGIAPEEVRSMRHEEYSARVVGACCRAALNGLDRRTILLNHSQLGTQTVAELFAQIGISPSEIHAEQLADSLRRYAKDPRPDRLFASDGESKRAALSDFAREMVERHTATVYAELEQVRRLQTPLSPNGTRDREAKPV